MITSLKELPYEYSCLFGYFYSKNGIEVFIMGGELEVEIDGESINPDHTLSPKETAMVIAEINRRNNPKGEYLTDTADGEAVFLQPETKQHLEAHSSISMEVIKSAINAISLYGTSFFMKTVNTEYTEETSLVERKPGDNVQMLYRKGRMGKSPVILNAKRELTNRVTIGICKENDSYYLFTAFFGEKAPREPWDCKTESERFESKKFWANHALICTEDEIESEV